MSEIHIDEILEAVWTEMEEGRDAVEGVLDIAEVEEKHEALELVKKAGFLVETGGRLKLTPEGERRARLIIRRHRLAERLFSEVLQLETHHIESNACTFEHLLSPEVTESVCTFLSHPPTCPHGKPIPRGECCEKLKPHQKPLVMRLSDLAPGDYGRIVFITPKNHARLDRLGSMGIMPDSVIKLHQKRPSYVIEIGETTLAIDSEISNEIFVRKV
ncbi:MAG: metal-dependent transcriptional regulator [Nitrospirota bacterium]|nr:metal-dependent transcriptional regulator [Nitrospirota bacterium]